MKHEELQEVLRLHALYLQGDASGERADLHCANLQGANLRDTNLQSANLQGANLRDTNLQGADLRGANLQDANLQGANLHCAALHGANLHCANLRGADLHSANLQGANLWGADLQGADLRGTVLENRALLTFQYNKHTAYYFGDGMLQIGCEKHELSKWLAEFEGIGKKHGYSSDEIAKYGKFIKGCVNIQKEMGK